ncbi:hypothetical protein CFOL_v3_19298 [Cephalotus follicularis]|uniref:Uncharacterized protein n=1 Tax=Cephalotus follicularis TaxID=3775 RepID=A0A1Q3C6W0_CEPFO|nr:hypothetical protein CFOL_v3_19298 [Cephalotus follicularis]
MQATKVLSSKFPCLPIFAARPCKKRPINRNVVASSRGPNNGRDYGAGRLVDENMVVLRMRIKEAKISEMNHEPPEGWMQWEKQYFMHYHSDVCEAIGLLQNYLMNVRPSFAIGIVALVALSVTISTGVTMFHAIEIAKGILSWIHLS